MTPDVSIIINVRNEEKLLPICLESIFNQNYKNFEVLVFDNCSTDKTNLICLKLKDKIKYFNAKQPLPLGLARQYAVNETNCPWVALCDADDTWHENKLTRQLNEITKTSSAFGYCGYTEVDENENL